MTYILKAKAELDVHTVFPPPVGEKVACRLGYGTGTLEMGSVACSVTVSLQDLQ